MGECSGWVDVVREWMGWVGGCGGWVDVWMGGCGWWVDVAGWWMR